MDICTIENAIVEFPFVKSVEYVNFGHNNGCLRVIFGDIDAGMYIRPRSGSEDADISPMVWRGYRMIKTPMYQMSRLNTDEVVENVEFIHTYLKEDSLNGIDSTRRIWSD